MKSSFLAVLLLTLAFAGCLPVSQNPLSDPEEATADKRLAGLWSGRSGADEVFLHMVSGKGATMHIIEVDHPKKGDPETTSYVMFPSAIGDNRYMNVQDHRKGKEYFLARYQIAKSGALTIWLMSENAAAKAVNAEKLKGNVTERSKTDRDVKITASTEQLAAFVRKADPEVLFDQKFATFKKITLPEVSAAPAATSSPTAKPEASPAKKKAAAE